MENTDICMHRIGKGDATYLTDTASGKVTPPMTDCTQSFTAGFAQALFCL